MPTWALIAFILLLFLQVILLARANASRRRALADLRAQKEFNENLINSATEMIISCDRERRINLFNPAAEKAFGYRESEVLGRDVQMLYAREDESKEVARAMSEDGGFAGEIMNRAKDGGEFPAFLCASEMRDKQGRMVGVMGISLDITRQKESEAERERLSRMKDEFLAIASHDLKSPLGSIAGYAQLLQKMAPPGEEMTEETYGFIQRIRNLSIVMQKIVEDFLDFNALQEGRLELARERINLNTLVGDTMDNWRDRAKEKEIVLECEPAENLPPVRVDGTRIEQVLENLVGNAVKFCYPDCRVVARTREEDGQARVEIIDDGPGLSDEDMMNVFVKYARLSARPTGGEKSSGLGLAICKQLIELHDGRVGVHNNESGGATFWFSLPADSDESLE